MKLLFCYDGPMNVDKDGNAYPQAFTEDVLSRYYTIADDFTMLTRTKLIDPKQIKIPKANMEKFRIVSCPNIASINGILVGHNEVKKILRQEIENSNYIIARLPSRIGNLAIDMARKMNKPYLVELVACRWDTLWYHSLKGKIIAPLDFYKTKKVIKASDAVVYITEKFLQSRYPTNGKQFVCANVALKSLDAAILYNRYEHIDNMYKRKRIVIASVGATNMRYKGHVYVIQAIGLLLQQRYDIEYHIIGGGNSSYLKKMANIYGVSDRVIFHGSLPHNEIFEILDNTDIYVQPSLAEAQGRSLIEAMSRGCPCVCTNVGGMLELIQEEFIARKADSKSLAEKIILILNTNIKQIARRNYEYVKKFDRVVMDKTRIEILKDVFK